MQAHGVEEAIDLFVIERLGEVEGKRTSFGRGQVLHRMEAEPRDIGLRPHGLVSDTGPKGMGGIGHHQRTAQLRLDLVLRLEERTGLRCDGHDLLHAGRKSANINRHDHLGAVGHAQ